MDSAVEGLKLGAFDYVMKPCDVADMLEKVGDAFAGKKAAEEKISRSKIERIISHPMAVFQKDE